MCWTYHNYLQAITYFLIVYKYELKKNKLNKYTILSTIN